MPSIPPSPSAAGAKQTQVGSTPTPQQSSAQSAGLSIPLTAGTQKQLEALLKNWPNQQVTATVLDSKQNQEAKTNGATTRESKQNLPNQGQSSQDRPKENPTTETRSTPSNEPREAQLRNSKLDSYSSTQLADTSKTSTYLTTLKLPNQQQIHIILDRALEAQQTLKLKLDATGNPVLLSNEASKATSEKNQTTATGLAQTPINRSQLSSIQHSNLLIPLLKQSSALQLPLKTVFSKIEGLIQAPVSGPVKHAQANENSSPQANTLSSTSLKAIDHLTGLINDKTALTNAQTLKGLIANSGLFSEANSKNTAPPPLPSSTNQTVSTVNTTRQDGAQNQLHNSHPANTLIKQIFSSTDAAGATSVNASTPAGETLAKASSIDFKQALQATLKVIQADMQLQNNKPQNNQLQNNQLQNNQLQSNQLQSNQLQNNQNTAQAATLGQTTKALNEFGMASATSRVPSSSTPLGRALGITPSSLQHSALQKEGLLDTSMPNNEARIQGLSADLLRAMSAYSAAQPKNRASANEDDSILSRLFQLLLGALSKTQTSQLTSLQQSINSSDPQLINTWTFELPFTQNKEYRSLELCIEEYQSEDGQKERSKNTWCVLLGFELDELGDLFIELKLIGEKASSTIWANHPAAYNAAKEELQFLRDALTAVGVEVTSIDCHEGEPPKKYQNWNDLDDSIVDLHT
jgi:hypothetical protein